MAHLCLGVFSAYIHALYMHLHRCVDVERCISKCICVQKNHLAPMSIHIYMRTHWSKPLAWICVWVDSLVVFIQAVGSVIVGCDFCVPATPPPFARALTLHVPYLMCLSLALYYISNPCTLVCTRFNKGFELELELVCSWGKVRSNVIYVNDEEEGAQDAALWHTRCDIAWRGCGSVDNISVK